MEIGVGELIRSGSLVELFPEWGDERFPLYVFYPLRYLSPATVRAFVSFVGASVVT